VRVGLLVLCEFLAVFPLAAEEPWVLETGPEAAESIPVDPVQPVPCWRGLYSDGNDRIWVYVTQSPFFFGQTVPDARVVVGTSWSLAAFFPSSWSHPLRAAWIDLWIAGFKELASLPATGWPAFPAVLRKG